MNRIRTETNGSAICERITKTQRSCPFFCDALKKILAGGTAYGKNGNSTTRRHGCLTRRPRQAAIGERHADHLARHCSAMDCVINTAATKEQVASWAMTRNINNGEACRPLGKGYADPFFAHRSAEWQFNGSTEKVLKTGAERSILILGEQRQRQACGRWRAPRHIIRRAMVGGVRELFQTRVHSGQKFSIDLWRIF